MAAGEGGLLCDIREWLDKGTRQRDEGGFRAVFLMALFLNSLRKAIVAERVGI